MIDRLLQTLTDKGVLATADRSRYICAFNNRANINLLLFDRKSREPLLFLKISDLRDFHSTFAMMKRVHAIAPAILPEPLSVFTIDRYTVLVTRAHRLTLLAAAPHLSRSRQRQILEAALQQLAELHGKTRQGTLTLDTGFLIDEIAPLAERLLRQWGDAELTECLQAYLTGLKAGWPLTVPSIPQHGDLVVFNTALADGRVDRLLFIDWDSYAKTRFAACDLVTFLITFSNLYGHGLYMPSHINDGIVGVAATYCSAVGLDRHLLADVYPLSLLYFAGLKLDIGVTSGQAFAHRELKRFFTEREQWILR